MKKLFQDVHWLVLNVNYIAILEIKGWLSSLNRHSSVSENLLVHQLELELDASVNPSHPTDDIGEES